MTISKCARAKSDGRSMRYADDDLEDAIKTWIAWWIKREPDALERAAFASGFEASN